MMIVTANILILALSVSLLGCLVASQDVEIRGPSEAAAELDGSSSGGGGGGGGQSRAIYSQRHLSPHRMMHFGKRPVVGQPPAIISSSGSHSGSGAWPPNAGASYYELMPLAHQTRLASPLQRQGFVAPTASANYLPFQFSLELENGQVLRAVPEDHTIAQAQIAPSFPLPAINRNLLYNFLERSPDAAAAIQQRSNSNQQQQQSTFASMNGDSIDKRQLLLNQLSGQRQDAFASGDATGSGERLSKLVEEVANSNDEVSSGAGDSSSSSSSERAQDNSQQQQPAINVSTRSMHSAGRSNMLSLPKAYFTGLMYGRAGSSSPSMSNFGAYNKKAEPKAENFFMHFGRK